MLGDKLPDPSRSVTNGFPGINSAVERGTLKRVMGIEEISEEAMGSVPDRNQTSMEG